VVVGAATAHRPAAVVVVVAVVDASCLLPPTRYSTMVLSVPGVVLVATVPTVSDRERAAVVAEGEAAAV